MNVRPSITNKMLDAETWDSLKAAGFSEQELLEAQPEGPMTSSYTRKDALADGALVDLMEDPFGKVVRQLGFTLHTAMTVSAFQKTILVGTELRDGEQGRAIYFPTGQSPVGRLWNALMALRQEVFAGALKSDRVWFSVDVDARGDGNRETVDLWSRVGPGDEGEAVMTIMLKGED